MQLAQNFQDIFGTIERPRELNNLPSGEAGVNQLIGNIVGLFFAAGSIAFTLMFVWGAVQMILSGGDKEAISKARARITWAIVGIVLMSLSYFIFRLLGAITGFNFFSS